MASKAILYLKDCFLNKREVKELRVNRSSPAISKSEDCSSRSSSKVLLFPKLVGAADIAEWIGCTGKHIYDLAKRGQIPHYRFGGSIRFDPEKVKAWLDQHEIAA
jgi:excisionase family DNA binding protein